MTVDQKRLLRVVGPTPLFVGVTEAVDGNEVHQEFFSWVAPASTNRHVVVMMRDGSYTHELLRRGATKLVLNRLSQDCLSRVSNGRLCLPLAAKPDDKFFLDGAVAAAVCTPEYSFLPAGSFTHHFVVLRVSELFGGAEETPRLFVENTTFMIPCCVGAEARNG